jgi:hypothetical protein
VRTFLNPGDTERDLGLRLGELVTNLSPAIGALTEGPVRLRLRERFRHEALHAAERATDRPVGSGRSPLGSPISSASPRWPRRSRRCSWPDRAKR